MVGDNVTLDRTGTRLGINTNPRFRTLTGAEIYDPQFDGLADLLIDRANEYGDPNWGGVAPLWGDFVITVHDSRSTWDGGTVLVQDGVNRTYGNEFVAGGPHDDTIFGLRGEDTIQGDGSLFFDTRESVTIDPASLNHDPLALQALLDGGTPLDTPQSFEALDDGDDYIEGGQDDDLIFGNLGQDDIVGGSSDLFGLDTQDQRPDSSDLIFGGAATNIARNDLGDAILVGGQVVNDVNAHSRDADTILGDNGNIYRLLEGTGTAFLTFSYDQTPDEDGSDRGDLRVVVRGTEWITDSVDGRQDYTPGGAEFDAANAQHNIGAADEIHGEAGDDAIHGMVGNDVLFGEGQDDDLIGGYGHDWISGGTGQDGVLGDDGRIFTNRNDGLSEDLYGIDGLGDLDLNLIIFTPDGTHQAEIHREGELRKTAILRPFNVQDKSTFNQDRWYDAINANDIIYGGWGDDFLHGGSGNDGISGAEALPQFYHAPTNSGDALQIQAGEFAAFDGSDALSKIQGFFLNFDASETLDGDDRIFGDLGHDWLVGGSGQDNLYGGYGHDLLNVDDDLETNGGANDVADSDLNVDRAYGGASADVLIGNTDSDRLIDWVSTGFDRYFTPDSLIPETITDEGYWRLYFFLYDLSESDGADPSRHEIAGAIKKHNGEPEGETGLVRYPTASSSATKENPALPGDTAHIDGFFADVALSDIAVPLIGTVDWGDGNTEFVVLVGRAFYAAHQYDAGGIYEVVVTIVNDDTGAPTAHTTAVVTGAGVHDGVLHVVGTNLDDQIQLSADGPQQIKLQADFLSEDKIFSTVGVSRIVVASLAGNDQIQISNDQDIPSWVDGGDGHDQIQVDQGDNVIFGGKGQDQLQAAYGDDILVGGLGSDDVDGNDGNDILIGGATMFGVNGPDFMNLDSQEQVVPVSGTTLFGLDREIWETIQAEWLQGISTLLNEPPGDR